MVPASAPSARIPLAIIANSHTPYRLHLHRRIVAEMPEVQLWSLYTHETSNVDWKFRVPAEINPVLFGKGESCMDQDKVKYAIKEWRRGGRIIRWLKQHDIKLVLVMGYNDAGRLRIIRWCRRHGVPCLLFGDSNIYGDAMGGIKAMAKWFFVRRIVRSCPAVLSCGILGHAYFAKYGARADRTFFFPYEPDYDLLQNLPAEKVKETRCRLGLAEGRRRMVYSGRLADVKRVDLLIDAFAAIAAQRPEWDLVLIGGGPLRQSLEARVPPELQSRVKWAGFVDDQATVSAIYRASDLLVLPSDYEPWALVINEAAAAGLAIVSSAVVGAAAELVREDVNGRLFPPGDLAKLIECLLDVTNEQRIEVMKAASPAVLADWRWRGDPIHGLRLAMASVGLRTEAIVPG